MDTDKKYNKLSIISFVATITAIIMGSIKVLAPVTGILMLLGGVCGVIAYLQIKKTGEKGKGLVISVFIVFILIIASMVLLYLPIF